MSTQLNLQTVEVAAKRLEDILQPTPLQYSERLSRKYGAQIYLKREDLMKVRSFKLRGAYNKISSLNETERKNGVVCASAGNHAQGVALSCAKLKIKGVIFMPLVTPNQKVEKVKYFGGKFIETVMIGDTFDEANEKAQAYCKKHKMTYVHPFNDYAVMAGQGTLAKEAYEELKGKMDLIISTVGGGGMLAGVATYIKEKNAKIKVVNAEPDSAPGLDESLKAGKVVTLKEMGTFVDGAAVRTMGDKTFAVLKDKIDISVIIPEGQICTSMIELYQSEGIITEPAGAVSVASLEKLASKIKGKTVVCVISGGNNDILRYPEILEKSLVYKGLKHYFVINFAQKPGQLKNFLNKALGPNDDIVRFEYIKKNNKETGPAFVGVELKNANDYQPLLKRMEKYSIHYEVINSKDLLYGYLV
ncbi:MAG: threonine ammonia-lyase IlvA [bacterium]